MNENLGFISLPCQSCAHARTIIILSGHRRVFSGLMGTNVYRTG